MRRGCTATCRAQPARSVSLKTVGASSQPPFGGKPSLRTFAHLYPPEVEIPPEWISDKGTPHADLPQFGRGRLLLLPPALAPAQNFLYREGKLFTKFIGFSGASFRLVWFIPGCGHRTEQPAVDANGVHCAKNRSHSLGALCATACRSTPVPSDSQICKMISQK